MILECIKSNSTVIIAISAFLSFVVTAILVCINWRLLKKYDRQYGLDIFYNSYDYKKDSRNRMAKLHKNLFNIELKNNRSLPAPPWMYTAKDQSLKNMQSARNAKKYEDILIVFHEAQLIFSDQKKHLDNVIKLLADFDTAIRIFLYNEKTAERQKYADEYIKAYNKLVESKFCIGYLDEELTLPVKKTL